MNLGRPVRSIARPELNAEHQHMRQVGSRHRILHIISGNFETGSRQNMWNTQYFDLDAQRYIDVEEMNHPHQHMFSTPEVTHMDLRVMLPDNTVVPSIPVSNERK